MGYQCFCTKPSEQGSFFASRSKWVQIVVCYDWNLQKHKYLSGISMFLHETFRTGLVFLSQLKWVQIVVCYMRNLRKCKYLRELPFWANLTDFFGKICHCGSFLASLVWKESKKLKNSKNLPMYLPPQEMQIFEILDEMRCFGGKRREKLWIAWKWPFRMNLSLIMGKNLQNDQNWPFWANLTHFFGSIWHCGSFSFDMSHA